MIGAAVPTLRTIPWLPVLASLPIALTIPLVAGRDVADAELVDLFRYAALILAIGLGFVLDDAAAPTITAVPTPLSVRRALRLVFALPVVIAAWTIMLTSNDTNGLSPSAITLEFAALIATALAIAALATRNPLHQRGGLIAGPTLFALFVAAQRLPEHWSLLPAPFTDQWPDAHHRWAAILAAAILAIVHASRDPAAVRRRLRTRGLSIGSVLPSGLRPKGKERTTGSASTASP